MSNLAPLKTTIATPAVPAAGGAGIQALTTPTAPRAGGMPKAPTGLAQGAAWKAVVPAQINDSVADKVKELSAQDSPLMEQAKTSGLQTANSRGLLNSSMAVGAVQDATLRSVLPIAQQDASQSFQKNMQATDQAFTGGQAEAQRDLDVKLQEASISATDRQQLRDISSREGLAAAERALQQLMQGKDIASRENLAAQDRTLQTTMQNKEIAYQTSERNLDRVLQEKLASWNLKSSDRSAAAQMLNNMQNSYENSYQSIMANTNLTAAAREAQIVSARTLRDKNLNLVEQMYNIDLTW